MWIQLCIRTSDVEIIFTPVKMNITLYKYLICSFQGTIANLWFALQAIATRFLYLSKLLAQFLDKVRTVSFYEKNSLFVLLRQSVKDLFIWIISITYVSVIIQMEIKGFEPLTPCLQGRCSPSWAIPPGNVYVFN